MEQLHARWPSLFAFPCRLCSSSASTSFHGRRREGIHQRPCNLLWLRRPQVTAAAAAGIFLWLPELRRVQRVCRKAPKGAMGFAAAAALWHQGHWCGRRRHGIRVHARPVIHGIVTHLRVKQSRAAVASMQGRGMAVGEGTNTHHSMPLTPSNSQMLLGGKPAALVLALQH